MRPLHRYVDEKGAAAYLRTGRMAARCRHYLPKELSGLPRGKVVAGLSFSEHPTKWASGMALCFVLDADRLPNRSATFDGQAVYELSDRYAYAELCRRNLIQPDWNGVERAYCNAIAASQDGQDETFVFGDVEDFRSALVAVHVCATVSPRLQAALEALCGQCGAALVNGMPDKMESPGPAP